MTKIIAYCWESDVIRETDGSYVVRNDDGSTTHIPKKIARFSHQYAEGDMIYVPTWFANAHG